MIKTLIDVQITVPFISYKNKTLNDKALKQIKRYIKEVVSEQINYIPLYVEKDREGTVFEDCSRKTTVKITKVKLKK